MSTYNTCTLWFRDLNSRIVCTIWPTIDQSNSVPGSVLSLAGAIQNCSSTKIVAVQWTTTALIGGVGVSGPYPTIYDRATLFSKTLHSNPQFIIPGPIASIFKPDNVTVDMDSPLVVAVKNALISAIGESTGSPVTGVKYGRRTIAGVGQAF